MVPEWFINRNKERLQVKMLERGLAGENKYDNKNEVPETTGESTRNRLSLAIINQLKQTNMFKSSSMFRGVVTMNNGTHKIIRVGVQMVARITTMFKEEKKNVFRNEQNLLALAGNDILNISEVKSIKFMYEHNHEELLTLA